MPPTSPSPESRWTARRLTVWSTGLLVLSWFIYAYTMSTPGLIDRAGRFKGTDHIYFFVMGSLMQGDRADDLYSPAAHLAEGRGRIEPGLALYAPYSNYGPQVAWAFMPLARLSYAHSLTLFLLFSAGCYALSVWLIWRDLPELARYGPLVALLAASSPLFLSLFRYAQLSAITLLLLSLALAAIRRDRRFLAGIALGTMIFKPTLGVLIGMTLLAAGEWRIVAGAAAAATAQIALAWSVSSTAVMRQYADVLWRLLRDPSLVQIYPTEVHSLRGFVQLLIPQSPLVGVVSLLGTLVMLATAIQAWRSKSEMGVRWGVLVLLTILASPHLLTYDLVLLSIPLLTLANWAVSHRDDRRHRAISVFLLLAYLTPFSSNLARLWPVQASVIVIGTLAWLGVSLSAKMDPSSDELRAASAAPRAA